MASLPQTIYKKATQTAAQHAQVAAKIARQEIDKTLDSAAQQVGVSVAETGGPRPENAPPQVVQTIQEVGPANIDAQQIAAQERALLSRLEGELARVRQEQQYKKQQYDKEQMQTMQQVTAKTQSAENPEPGILGRMARGAKRMMSGKRQETKAGSGKN